MTANSNASVAYVTADKATATAYGLKLFAYEGGPASTNGGDQLHHQRWGADPGQSRSRHGRAGANPHPQQLVRQGGDMFGYFVLSCAYSRYGDWGATDDYTNLTTAKYNALVNLTGYEPNGVPFSPGDLVATADANAVDLAWQPVPGASSYSVYRGLASGAESATAITTVSATSYTDSGLTNGTTYYYTVTGANSTGASTPSNEANATPSAPPDFTVAGTSVTVEPGATTGNTSTITLTPSNGFTGSVALTAAVTSGPSGATDPPSLSFGATSPVSLTTANAGSATLTISTIAATSSALARPTRPGSRWYTAASTSLACILLFCIPAGRRSWRRKLGMLIFLAFLAGGLISCGGGGGGSGGGGGGGGNPGTSAGAYTITVTGTSGALTETGTITLTVQ